MIKSITEVEFYYNSNFYSALISLFLSFFYLSIVFTLLLFLSYFFLARLKFILLDDLFNYHVCGVLNSRVDAIYTT